MNETGMTDELDKLLIEHESDMLDEAGYARLREILKQDAAAREHYLQWQMVNLALTSDESDNLAGEYAHRNEKQSVELADRKTHRRESYRWVTAAAALTLSAAILVAAIHWWPESNSGETADNQINSQNREADDVEETSEGVAILTKLVDVTWKDDASKQEAGDALKPGLFAIESGFAQIEFFSGATLVVEGPAQLEFKSSNLAKVHRGKLRANVPEVARGFTLEVDGARVVDLGTEFGLDVDENKMDVQVFEGLVELYPERADSDQDEQMKTIRAGGGITRMVNGDLRRSRIEPEKFVTLSQLESRQERQVRQRAQAWTDWSRKIREDNRVIAYYSFDQSESWFRKLECVSHKEEDERHGAIIGAKQVTGRWESKGGLEFTRPGDRVRMNIPGEFGSLTFAAWVKIDSLDRMYNSLFLTDNYNQGEPHWQILESGQLFFSVRWRSDNWVRGKSPNGAAHYPVISPAFWKPSLSGKWIHLATTFDVESGLVTHYLNGKQIHAETIPSDLMVQTTRIGEATMGNWSIPTQSDERFAIRNLNGTIDEMLILKTALSGDEVKSIFRNGKP